MDTIEAVGKHDFNASTPDELSFRKGDHLQIIDMETDPNWYRATMGANTGYIPNNYIEIVQRDWLMPDVTRQMAEQMLLSKSNNQYINSDGAFLVRRGRQEGEHSLSVKYLNEVQHFKIYKQNDGYFIWDSEKFPTLSLLVRHYKTASVSKSHHIILQDMVKENRVRAKASYDFTGRGNDELSFRKGDILNITDRQDSDWWTAQIGNGPSGLIPATYVELL